MKQILPRTIPHGFLFKNSSKPIHGLHYKHPIDGHGFINRFHFHKDGIEYKGIRQKTYHYNREKILNRVYFRGLGTNGQNQLFINNFNNVAMFAYENMLFSIGEGGIPYEIDPYTGDTIGSYQLSSFPKSLIESLPYLPNTPHPTSDKDIVFNMSSLNCGFCIWNSKTGIIHSSFYPNLESFYFHDFKMTDNFIIVFLNKVHSNLVDMYMNNLTILESISFEPGSKIMIVNRRSFETVYVDLPEEYYCLHLAHVIESFNEIEIFGCISKSMNLANVNNLYDFDGINLHSIQINTSNLKGEKMVIQSIRKCSNICSEMPKKYKQYIFTINKTQLIRTNCNTYETVVLNFEDDGALEEPSICNDTLFLIQHLQNQTKIICVDTNLFKVIYTEAFKFSIPYGFHGLFWQTSCNI